MKNENRAIPKGLASQMEDTYKEWTKNDNNQPQPEADRQMQIPDVMRSYNFEKVGTDFDFIAINKETGEKVVVDIISMTKKQAYIKGKWERIDAMNFSKRGKWELILQYK